VHSTPSISQGLALSVYLFAYCPLRCLKRITQHEQTENIFFEAQQLKNTRSINISWEIAFVFSLLLVICHRNCIQGKNSHYRAYLKMYGKMMQDLSDSDEYVTRLIDNNGLSKFETGLRNLIEKCPKY